MSQKVRCKVACSYVNTESKESTSLVFSAVYSGSKENEEFFKYTPALSLQISCANNEATKMFKPGNEYYLDITPAEKEGDAT